MNVTDPRSYVNMLAAIAAECRASSGEAVRIAPDEFDGAAKMLRDLSGENAVLAGLLRDCDAVLAVIEADDGDDAESVRDLRLALAYALDPYKREGTLL